MNGNGIVGNVASGAHGAVNKATQAAHHAVDSAAGAAAPAAEWIGAKADAARAMPERLVKDGRAVVENHPWAVAGVALAVGLLVGRILR